MLGDDLAARDLAVLERTLDRLGPIFSRAWQPRIEGAEHLLGHGASLVVGNHSGGPLAMVEPLVLAHALRPHVPLDRMPHLLLHEVMWHGPLARLSAKLGAVRASPENARGLLRAGAPVLVYPGGDREAFRGFRDRDRVQLGARTGYLRLAITEGVPIVPVVTAGMHSGLVVLSDGHEAARRFPLARGLRVGVLPVTLSVPFGLSIGVPPPYVPLSGGVRIRVLPPLRFTRTGPEAAADTRYLEACHASVTRRMQRALDELAGARRAERRASLHAHLDRALDALERWTIAGPPPRESEVIRLSEPPPPAVRRAA